jgi:hypothetical protein
MILSYETAKMHCSFISEDRKNTRWRKADIGNEGVVAFREKPNGAFSMRIGAAQPASRSPNSGAWDPS